MSDAPSSAEASASSGVAQATSDGFARRSLLRRLMDVVALPSSRGNLQDRAIAGDLLLEILLESDVAARELCARRLQEMSQAPKRLLRFLALDVPHGYAVCQALGAREIVVDFRPDAGLRVAPHFYNTEAEVVACVQAVREILDGREYERFLQQERKPG